MSLSSRRIAPLLGLIVVRLRHGIQSTNIAPKDVIFLDGLAQELMTDPQLVIKWRDLR